MSCLTIIFIADSSEAALPGPEFGFLRGRKGQGGRVSNQGRLRGDLAMTQKTEGGGQERQEGGPGRRDGAPPPRSYSEFMRSLAAKYNNENPAEYVDKYEDKNTHQPIHYSGPAGLR